MIGRIFDTMIDDMQPVVLESNKFDSQENSETSASFRFFSVIKISDVRNVSCKIIIE